MATTTLGFRLPQFSEDVAWLPNWLQNPVSTPSDLVHELLHSDTQLPVKDLTINREGCEVVFSEEKENAVKRMNLFLSADEDTDHTQTTHTPSQLNYVPQVLHLHLHLSSDAYSECSRGQLLHASQAPVASSNVQASQLLEMSSGFGLNDKIHLSKHDYDGNYGDHGSLATSQMDSVTVVIGETLISHSSDDDENCAMQNIDLTTNNVDGIQSASVSVVPASVEEAVVMSAASDKDGRSPSGSKSNVRCIGDSDIDDAVELSIAASEALVIHEVVNAVSASDILPLEAIVEAALRVKQARLDTLKDIFSNPSDEADDGDLITAFDDRNMVDAFADVGLSVTFPDNQQDCSDVSQVKDTLDSEDEGHDNSSRNVHHMAQKSQNLPASVASYLHVDHMEYVSDALDRVLPHVVNSLDESHSGSADRFRSRWLGGWTAKAGDASAALNRTINKNIPKFFAGETSFLSESAEDAPDENSFVQRRDRVTSTMASQSSVPFQGFNAIDEDDILVSEDIRSSNLSFVDPLCSVVPCSVSLQNTSSQLAQNQNEQERSPCSNSCIEGENIRRTSDLAESSMPPSQRLLTSLADNHLASPRHDSLLELGGQFLNQLPLENAVSGQDKVFFKSSDNSKSKDLMSLNAAGVSVNQDPAVVKFKQPASATMCRARSHKKCGNNMLELHAQESGQMNMPAIQNSKSCSRLTPSTSFLPNFTKEKGNKRHAAQIAKFHQSHNLQKLPTKRKHCYNTRNQLAKRIRFLEVEVDVAPQANKDLERPQDLPISIRSTKKTECPSALPHSQTWDAIKRHIKDVTRLVFHGLEFLLTGYSGKKERKLIELIEEHGGIVLSDIPPSPNSRTMENSIYSNRQLPLVICSKKLQTAKFLYGCAVNAPILKLRWLTNSVKKGSVLPPEGYMILPHQEISNCQKLMLYKVGVMLLGGESFCTKLTKIIKHGGGQVFRTLQMLFQNRDSDKISFAVIVTEEPSRVSRHLSHCAKELSIPVKSATWIVRSLHLGRLLYDREDSQFKPRCPVAGTCSDWSQEI